MKRALAPLITTLAIITVAALFWYGTDQPASEPAGTASEAQGSPTSAGSPVDTSSNKTSVAEAEAPAAPTLVESMLFFPTKYPEGDWQPAGLVFEDITFASTDGTRLHGWWCPAEQPRGVVLLAHGNAGHVASRAGWLRYLQREARLSVFAFDYRGYGRSEGVPTIDGALRDAKAARAKLCELAQVQDSEMFLMGESLGGAIAVSLAADSAPRGLILQSTFSSLREVAGVHFPGLSWLVPPGKLNSAEQIARYQGPLLQSHGRADQTIPYALGQRLFQAANEPKRFVTLEYAGHNDWLTDEYVEQLEAFVDHVEDPRR